MPVLISRGAPFACPICHGMQRVPGGFYEGQPKEEDEPCRSCDRGVVWGLTEVDDNTAIHLWSVCQTARSPFRHNGRGIWAEKGGMIPEKETPASEEPIESSVQEFE